MRIQDGAKEDIQRQQAEVGAQLDDSQKRLEELEAERVRREKEFAVQSRWRRGSRAKRAQLKRDLESIAVEWREVKIDRIRFQSGQHLLNQTARYLEQPGTRLEHFNIRLSANVGEAFPHAITQRGDYRGTLQQCLRQAVKEYMATWPALTKDILPLLPVHCTIQAILPNDIQAEIPPRYWERQHKAAVDIYRRQIRINTEKAADAAYRARRHGRTRVHS